MNFNMVKNVVLGLVISCVPSQSYGMQGMGSVKAIAQYFKQSVPATEPFYKLLSQVEETENPSYQNEYGNTVLHYLACRGQYPTRFMLAWIYHISVLMSIKNNPEAKIPEGIGSEHEACAFFKNLDEKTTQEIVKLLGIRNNKDQTPMMFANAWAVRLAEDHGDDTLLKFLQLLVLAFSLDDISLPSQQEKSMERELTSSSTASYLSLCCLF